MVNSAATPLAVRKHLHRRFDHTHGATHIVPEGSLCRWCLSCGFWVLFVLCHAPSDAPLVSA